MGSRRNVITLNGNRYDASTGKLLDSPNNSGPVTPKTSGANIDGFVNNKKPSGSRGVRTISRSALKSKTLMRSAVTKPDTQKQTTKPSPSVVKTSTPDNLRSKRAETIKKSKLISRFGFGNKNITKLSTIPVAEPPKENYVSNKKAFIPAPPNMPIDTPKSDGVFKKAMAKSDNHANPRTKKVTRRHKLAKKMKISPSLLNISMFLLGGIILGGYIAYQNVPNLAMRLASTRSGIQGTMPSYQPSGFSLNGPIEYKTGQITIDYKSNSDDREYTVTQNNSEWNSDALLNNHVSTNGRQFQTFQDKGKTIYIYDNNSASWVDNGIWYEVKGNDSLNTDQLLRIANSL